MAKEDTEDVTGHGDRALLPRLSWGTLFALGLITLILGAVIVARPTLSLIAIAVLLGVTMIVSGIYHIARALDGQETERVWRGISGVLFLLAGLVLLRHLHLSIALIGLFIGFTWIIQGVSSLMEGFSSGRRGAEAAWPAVFGIISLIAGIVVISAPISSVGVLTTFMGIWFIVMGVLEMVGSLITRRAERKQGRGSGKVSVPGQRSGTAGHDQAATARHAAASQARPQGDPARSADPDITG